MLDKNYMMKPPCVMVRYYRQTGNIKRIHVPEARKPSTSSTLMAPAESSRSTPVADKAAAKLAATSLKHASREARVHDKSRVRMRWGGRIASRPAGDANSKTRSMR